MTQLLQSATIPMMFVSVCFLLAIVFVRSFRQSRAFNFGCAGLLYVTGFVGGVLSLIEANLFILFVAMAWCCLSFKWFANAKRLTNS